MARRRKQRNALHEGLMGAVLGGLQFQLGEHTRRQLEEAELRKEARLDALAAAREERTLQHQLTRDASLHEQQQAALKEQQAFIASENAANRAVQREGHAVSRDNARLSAEQRAPEYQTFTDETGQIHRLPLTAEGDARLRELQGAGTRLQLMEGTRGGRFTALPGSEGAAAGNPGATGAASRAPAAQPSVAFDFIDGMLRPIK